MKHIILPTDFSIRSLQPIHEVLHQYGNEAIKITMLHLVDFPTGIGELLFHTRRIARQYPVPPDFREACEVMCNRYGTRITAIRPIVRHGSTAAFLENLLTGMGTDAVVVHAGFSEKPAFPDSIPLMPLLRRCSFPIIEVTKRADAETAGASTVGDLLLSAGCV